jgi:DNA polymerase III subunit epsilon
MIPQVPRLLLDTNCVAVDFETANRHRNSACALGIVVITDGEVTDQKKWQFQPHACSFELRNTRIHGISPQDVANWPQLKDLWSEIEPFFDKRHIIAHYAQFDVSVLQQSLYAIGIPYPTFEYTCTWRVARRVWPGFLAFDLPYLAERLGLSVDHNNALADARTCWAILLEACRCRRASSVRELEEDVRLLRSKFSPEAQVRSSQSETDSAHS